MRPSQAIIIQLINLMRKQASSAEIEELLKKDPTLSFNLLRFINSSGFGLQCEITSFRHAVMILGLKKLFRWAALLLTTSRAGGSPPAVGTMAVVRGRLMELLALELLPAEECDNAFVVGVFSMLDTMLGMPLEKALEFGGAARNSGRRPAARSRHLRALPGLGQGLRKRRRGGLCPQRRTAPALEPPSQLGASAGPGLGRQPGRRIEERSTPRVVARVQFAQTFSRYVGVDGGG
jgi:hypothetical protein